MCSVVDLGEEPREPVPTPPLFIKALGLFMILHIVFYNITIDRKKKRERERET